MLPQKINNQCDGKIPRCNGVPCNNYMLTYCSHSFDHCNLNYILIHLCNHIIMYSSQKVVPVDCLV